jgi:hypothetical protein
VSDQVWRVANCRPVGVGVAEQSVDDDVLNAAKPDERTQPEARRRHRLDADEIALMQELEPRILAVVRSRRPCVRWRL